MAICGGFHDGNMHDLLESRCVDTRHDANRSLQMHSSLVQRLSHEKKLEGHQGCVNAIAWNSSGSLLISGSDDTRRGNICWSIGALFAKTYCEASSGSLSVEYGQLLRHELGSLGGSIEQMLQVNIWSYSGRKLLHSIDTGHSANIFCTKFVPETSDELVVSGAGDTEVRLFNLSRLDGRGTEENAIPPSALFQCHTGRVKKLAVEVGNPNVVWSACEDGTLRQHDFREGNSCPPAGSLQQECRSVLLDLRSGSKKSLTDPPKGVLALKSCDISSTRPHLFLVGGSDAFARLYDRRMLPPLTSCRKKMAPPPCVNYFCPMHLSDRGRSSLHLTHVTFSPNGEEVLLSYSGEHVYLMNVNSGGNLMKYTAADVSKLTTFAPWPNGVEMQPTISKNYPHHLAASQLEKCQSLMQFAEASLREGTNYYHGIEACNEVLDGHGQVIEPALRLECLCTRAALLLKRKWKNDVHMAIRDCQRARMIDTSSVRPLYYMSEALSQLGKHKEALEFALSAQCLSPSDPKLEERVQDIKQRLAAAESEKNNKVTNGAPRSEPRGARVLSLGDILFRSEANSDASQDGPRSEREESDYDEEMEVDFETSISGDEGRDVESNVLHGSLNLRIHRRVDSSRETASTNDSCGSPSSSSQNDKIPYQPEAVIDMKQRYVGHCNMGTDIKQANFLGQRGEYVASGSDDGRWFIWEKRTGRLIKMLLGDEAVVNCVQCHPFDCVVATSGIDNTIKIWTPSARAPSIVAGVAAGPETANVVDAMENNERRLIHNREIILPFEILERLRMHESTECAQS